MPIDNGAVFGKVNTTASKLWSKDREESREGTHKQRENDDYNLDFSGYDGHKGVL